MPYVKMEITRDGVTREHKRALVHGVTKLLHEILHKDPELTFVTIAEIERDDWGIGGKLVSERAPLPPALPATEAPARATRDELAGAGDERAGRESEARRELLACVATYLDGLYFADPTRLRAVFHPRARYFSSAEGALKELDLPSYLALVEARTAPAATQQPRYDRVLSVDVAGPHTALVKLECALPPRHFTDYLSFVHDQGRWSIISKVFEVRSLR